MSGKETNEKGGFCFNINLFFIRAPFCPAGVSTLDIRTRLRITEAELGIVQREYSDLLAEKNALESSLRQYEESWKFAVQELGRVVEQRDDALKRVELCEKVEKVGSQQDVSVVYTRMVSCL